MMDSEIYETFADRLVDNVFDMKIVLPNMDDEPRKPYLLIDVVPTMRSNRSLSGGVEFSEGFCQITLVSETNDDDKQIIAKAEQIAALFPHRLRVGDLLLTDPPMIENGYRDGPDWRTPIRINYQTNTQT